MQVWGMWLMKQRGIPERRKRREQRNEHECGHHKRIFSLWKTSIGTRSRMTSFFFYTRSKLTWKMAQKNTVCLNTVIILFIQFIKYTINNITHLNNLIMDYSKIAHYLTTTCHHFHIFCPYIPQILKPAWSIQACIYKSNRHRLRPLDPLLPPQSAFSPRLPSGIWLPSPTPRARTSSWPYVMNNNLI